jgi:flavin-dependent dehydrogenase
MEEVEVYFGRDIAPGFFAWVVPTVPGMARVGLMTRRQPAMYLRRWLEHLASWGRVSLDGEAPAIRCGGVPLRPLPRTFGERLLVVGDAAGQVKPISGGGIYYGLIAADIAAATLREAQAEGDLSAKRLGRYHRAWRRKLGRELRTGYWARRLYERLGDRMVDRIFRLIREQGIDTALLEAEDLTFDWHSRTLSRLVRYQVLSRATGALRTPFEDWIDPPRR